MILACGTICLIRGGTAALSRYSGEPSKRKLRDVPLRMASSSSSGHMERNSEVLRAGQVLKNCSSFVERPALDLQTAGTLRHSEPALHVGAVGARDGLRFRSCRDSFGLFRADFGRAPGCDHAMHPCHARVLVQVLDKGRLVTGMDG